MGLNWFRARPADQRKEEGATCKSRVPAPKVMLQNADSLKPQSPNGHVAPMAMSNQFKLAHSWSSRRRNWNLQRGPFERTPRPLNHIETRTESAQLLASPSALCSKGVTHVKTSVLGWKHESKCLDIGIATKSNTSMSFVFADLHVAQTLVMSRTGTL